MKDFYKTIIISVGFIVCILIIQTLLVRVFPEFNPDEDTSSTSPATSSTTAPIPTVSEIPADLANHIKEKSDLIVLESPQSFEKISSPVTIKGKARGYWFFEASFPVTVVNWDGLIIGEGIAIAEGDWMTENFVPFTATIDFTYASTTPYNSGSLILKKDNPSGLPENDDALEIPIVLGN